MGPRVGASLSVDFIDGDSLEVVAEGNFSADCREDVARRLDVLLGCGFRHLRIDLARVASLDPSLAEVFVEAAWTSLRRRCSFELIHPPAAVADALGAGSTEASGEGDDVRCVPAERRPLVVSVG